MGKCMNCGNNEAVGRSKYCSNTCRALYSKRNRNEAQPTETEAQPISATNLELCRFCGMDLPRLSKLRQEPGACYECALKQPVRDGDDLWPEYRWDQKPFSEQPYEMTAFEREHYRPAASLGKGEYNPVSLPGRACYAGVSND